MAILIASLVVGIPLVIFIGFILGLRALARGCTREYELPKPDAHKDCECRRGPTR